MANQQPPSPPPAPPGGYGGQGYYPQQQPPKKRGGCGKAVLIALAVIVGLVVVGAIIGAVAGGGDDDDTATDDDSTETTEASGTTTAPGASEAPAETPRAEGDEDEVDDVTMTECVNDPALEWAVARGSITNDSSEMSTYFIEVNILDTEGTVVGNAISSVANVPADGTATWEAPSTVALPAGGQCVITSVDRFAA